MKVMILLMVFAISTLPLAHAQSFTNETPLGLKLKLFIFDLHESLVFNQDVKTQVVAQHAHELQEEIETRVANNEPIPQELEQKRIEKINKAQGLIQATESIPDDTPEQSRPALESVKERLQALSNITEVNEIRILWSEFPRVINSDNQNLKDQYNQRVNSLDSWKENCIGTFDVDNYTPISESYELLSEDCPPLKQFDQKRLKAIVSGQV